ncbi:MAG: GIY-YIG nuclease family protein [Acidobacteria bacterium]|nr:GIY-YIG nuclease family protein [Acidobacteriota bacterium]
MERHPCVYILSSKYKRLYIGVTSNLMKRMFEHKNPEPDSFSFAKRYNINRLVYVEHFETMAQAIAREKQLKGWVRLKKFALIVSKNPTWRDLSEEWTKQIEPYRWTADELNRTEELKSAREKY